MKVLIFGLPGAGKTYLAERLMNMLGNERAEWVNADTVRKEADDWDFSERGRERQNQRMRILADAVVQKGKIAICDFICPTEDGRDLFGADYEIFVDTIEKGRFADTNKLFERPDYENYDCVIPHYVVTEKRLEVDARLIMWDLLDIDTEAPTAQMLGRYQPWHEGHRALFERLFEKYGQVCVMVRNMTPDENNPDSAEMIKRYIELELAVYAGYAKVMIVPNITHIGYGRNVGYTIGREHFDADIETISATKIRNQQ